MMHTINTEEFCPVPFPEGLPTIELERISLSKLLNDDDAEARKMFETCTRTGFFYLNMLDHPIGRKMMEDAYVTCRVAKDVFTNLPMDEKRTYKTPPRVGVFDRGYSCPVVDAEGQPNPSEALNIPQYELLTDERTDFALPSWLANDGDIYQAVMRQGNFIANAIFSVLERHLQLPSGAITSLHRLTDRSSDFLRILRYRGFKSEKPQRTLGLPAHTDAVSIAMLFTWLGGLQVLRPDVDAAAEAEDSWRWVKPLPGYAIVNLGDAMQILTNKVLKSGMHRVVKAPGEQAAYDKYSVLVVSRPADNTPMKAFKSPVIPNNMPEQAITEVMTCKQWGNDKVKAFVEVMTKG